MREIAVAGRSDGIDGDVALSGTGDRHARRRRWNRSRPPDTPSGCRRPPRHHRRRRRRDRRRRCHERRRRERRRRRRRRRKRVDDHGRSTRGRWTSVVSPPGPSHSTAELTTNLAQVTSGPCVHGGTLARRKVGRYVELRSVRTRRNPIPESGRWRTYGGHV